MRVVTNLPLVVRRLEVAAQVRSLVLEARPGIAQALALARFTLRGGAGSAPETIGMETSEEGSPRRCRYANPSHSTQASLHPPQGCRLLKESAIEPAFGAFSAGKIGLRVGAAPSEKDKRVRALLRSSELVRPFRRCAFLSFFFFSLSGYSPNPLFFSIPSAPVAVKANRSKLSVSFAVVFRI